MFTLAKCPNKRQNACGKQSPRLFALFPVHQCARNLVFKLLHLRFGDKFRYLAGKQLILARVKFSPLSTSYRDETQRPTETGNPVNKVGVM